jgi:hypothetical protein
MSRKTPAPNPRQAAISKLQQIINDESLPNQLRLQAAQALTEALRPAVPPAQTSPAGSGRGFTTVYDDMPDFFADCPGSVTVTPQKTATQAEKASEDKRIAAEKLEQDKRVMTRLYHEYTALGTEDGTMRADAIVVVFEQRGWKSPRPESKEPEPWPPVRPTPKPLPIDPNKPVAQFPDVGELPITHRTITRAPGARQQSTWIYWDRDDF